MTLKEILEILLGDIVFAALIGAVNVWASNRSQRQNEQLLEKEMAQMKEVIEIHLTMLQAVLSEQISSVKEQRNHEQGK